MSVCDWSTLLFSHCDHDPRFVSAHPSQEPNGEKGMSDSEAATSTQKQADWHILKPFCCNPTTFTTDMGVSDHHATFLMTSVNLNGGKACIDVALKASESQQTRRGTADFALRGRLNKASGCRNYAVYVSFPSILKFNQTNGNNKVEYRPSLDLRRLTMSNHGREILKNPND